MSRIGKNPVPFSKDVTVQLDDTNTLTVKGPKGELKQTISSDLTVTVNESDVVLTRPSESKSHKSQHGLYRSLVLNMIQGVSEGYTIELELVGVGYKAVCNNNVLELNLGYSHPIFFQLPDEVTGSAKTEKGKNPKVTLESIDKQLVGQVASKLRSLRKVEPYKGKGVRYVGEQVRRKVGKAAAK